MRVFDDPEHITERIFDGRYFDPSTDVLHWFMNGRAKLDDSLESSRCICDTPISDRTVGFVRLVAATRLQTQLISGNIESNVKRLVEIRLYAEHFAVPGFALVDVVD